MPSRLITAAILAFWLGMTAWLIHREVVPMMIADSSPTYVPDLTDEIGAPMIAWRILHKGQAAGSATSVVQALDNRAFEFRSTFFLKSDFYHVSRIESMQRVNEDGSLRAMRVKIDLRPGLIVNQIEFKGEVEDQKMQPRVFLDGAEFKDAQLGKLDLAEQGSVVNSFTLVGRMRGLWEGRTWKVPMLDLGRLMPDDPFGLKKMAAVPTQLAKVRTDSFRWEGKEVACYVVEYHEVGKEVGQRTWVRRQDGLVLKWDLSMLGVDMVLERAKDH